MVLILKRSAATFSALAPQAAGGGWFWNDSGKSGPIASRANVVVKFNWLLRLPTGFQPVFSGDDTGPTTRRTPWLASVFDAAAAPAAVCKVSTVMTVTLHFLLPTGTPPVGVVPGGLELGTAPDGNAPRRSAARHRCGDAELDFAVLGDGRLPSCAEQQDWATRCARGRDETGLSFSSKVSS